MNVERLIPVKVIENRKIAPHSYVLQFQRFFDFRAGQVVKISLDKQLAPRIYSVASAEADNLVEILYKVIPSGELTPKLEYLKTGDIIYVSNPFGRFTFQEGVSCLIATGTGIAPFVSFLRSGQARNSILIHGSRTKDELYYSREIQTILSDNYYPCLSQEQNNSYFQGRVTHFLKTKFKVQDNIMYYLCGSAEMVVEARDILIENHVPFGNIFSEIYF